MRNGTCFKSRVWEPTLCSGIQTMVAFLSYISSPEGDNHWNCLVLFSGVKTSHFSNAFTHRTFLFIALLTLYLPELVCRDVIFCPRTCSYDKAGPKSGPASEPVFPHLCSLGSFDIAAWLWEIGYSQLATRTLHERDYGRLTKGRDANSQENNWWFLGLWQSCALRGPGWNNCFYFPTA